MIHIPTYIGLLNFASNLRISIAIKFLEKTLLLWKFDFAIIIIVPSVLTLHKLHIDMAYFPWSCRKPLFISLYKFFSNSFFAKVLNFVLSLIRKPCIVQIVIHDGSLWCEDYDEYIIADCDNVCITLLHTMSREALPSRLLGFSHVG